MSILGIDAAWMSAVAITSSEMNSSTNYPKRKKVSVLSALSAITFYLVVGPRI